MLLLNLWHQSHREVEVSPRVCALINSPRDSRKLKIGEPLKQMFNKRMPIMDGGVRQHKGESPAGPAECMKVMDRRRGWNRGRDLAGKSSFSTLIYIQKKTIKQQELV